MKDHAADPHDCRHLAHERAAPPSFGQKRAEWDCSGRREGQEGRREGPHHGSVRRGAEKGVEREGSASA